MEKQYAQALFNLSRKPGANVEDLTKKLIENLRATGRIKLLPRILRELRRIETRAEVFSDVLEVATELERDVAEEEARALGIQASAIVNESLITGWRAKSGGRSIDRSGKRALLDLYRQILRNA